MRLAEVKAMSDKDKWAQEYAKLLVDLTKVAPGKFTRKMDQKYLSVSDDTPDEQRSLHLDRFVMDPHKVKLMVGYKNTDLSWQDEIVSFIRDNGYRILSHSSTPDAFSPKTRSFYYLIIAL